MVVAAGVPVSQVIRVVTARRSVADWKVIRATVAGPASTFLAV